MLRGIIGYPILLCVAGFSQTGIFIKFVIDHSVMENLHHFDDDYTRAGGTVEFLGHDQLKPVSAHPLAARKRSKAS
jgi:hypothetical protein